MGGTSTYGIEKIDGSVVYNIYGNSIFHHSILYEFQKGRTVEVYYDEYYVASSIEDYYSEKRYCEEDSKVRGLLRIDGTLEYRMWGDIDGIFTYKKE
jgi:hypothetical protein